MSLPKITSYEVKTSRTGQKVPVVNGVHLHSIYNPDKEAEGLISAQIEALKNKNEVLILGLGFAYHVNAVIEKLSQFHGDNFKIIVIEPNIQVYEDCIAFELLNKKNVLIYSGFNSNELYSDLDLVHFLLKKPAMIAHPPSFNLYQNYFKDILTFEAPKKISSILPFVESAEIKKYLGRFDPESTLENVLYNEIPKQNQFDQADFLAMALVEMTRKTHEKKSSLGDQ
ncbi:MAG: hypothetical protein ACXVLQ_02860 [Bacteriovorax sp.]